MKVTAAKSQILLCLALALAAGGCGKRSTNCSALTGSPWTPAMTGLGPQYHSASVTLAQETQTLSGPVTGLQQPVTPDREITVNIDMNQDLGANGSLTLEAKTTAFPSALDGSAWPVLVSLNDGVHELINLTLTGTGGDCAQTGLFQCQDNTCVPNPACGIKPPSSFSSREDWEQHNAAVSASALNAPTIYRFPTCNWEGGTPGSVFYPDCAFNSTFFVNNPTPRLRTGTYVAKYILLSDSYPTVNGQSAAFQFEAYKKIDDRRQPGGAVDLNVILVGNDNINASRTPKGQQNLNTLISMVQNFYQKSLPNFSLGQVTPVEWTCDAGGDAYSNLATSQVGAMFSAAAAILPKGEEHKAVNIFLLSSIHDDTNSLNPSLTVLGLDGAIVGPMDYATAESGLAAATFDELGSFNPKCPPSSPICDVTAQESAFYELSETVAHEMGHYLGLNHPAEANGRIFDNVVDTPVCTATQNFGSLRVITQDSCRLVDSNEYPQTERTCSEACSNYDSLSGEFCPQAPECEFNYLMWWMTKNFVEGTGLADGDMISPGEGVVINYSPYVY